MTLLQCGRSSEVRPHNISQGSCTLRFVVFCCVLVLVNFTKSSTVLHWHLSKLIVYDLSSSSGRFRLSTSTVIVIIKRAHELSGVTHVTPFRTYGYHPTGLCYYKLEERTYWNKTCCGCGRISEEFPNMASDWLGAMLAANQMPG